MNSILLPWTIATTILLFVAAFWIYTLEKKVANLSAKLDSLAQLAGTADEKSLIKLLTSVEVFQLRLDEITGRVTLAENALSHSVQGMGMLRYGAYEGVGGDQSFSLALVDSEGNGVIVTGLHGHADIRIYAKPLVQWRSSYSLSSEEQNALGKARLVVENRQSV